MLSVRNQILVILKRIHIIETTIDTFAKLNLKGTVNAAELTAEKQVSLVET